MKQFFAKILAVFLLVFLTGCVINPDKSFEEILIDNGIDVIKINVEIADDNKEREKGLMFRERLNENDGMLFIFDYEEYRTFWMKNTLIALDMIFIDENLEINGIVNAVPCREDPCIVYESSKPAKYVLEVNSGFAAKNSIKIGDKIILNKKVLKQG